MLGIASRRLGFICASVGLIGLISLAPQCARASDDVQLCDNSINDPDEGIPACTRIINGPQISKPESVFNNRGNAWFRKGVYPSAIDDYSAAIERNPRIRRSVPQSRVCPDQSKRVRSRHQRSKIRRSSSIPNRPSHSIFAGLPYPTRVNSKGRSATSMRRLRSRAIITPPTCIAAMPGTASGTSTRPLRISIRPSRFRRKIPPLSTSGPRSGSTGASSTAPSRTTARPSTSNPTIGAPIAAAAKVCG